MYLRWMDKNSHADRIELYQLANKFIEFVDDPEVYPAPGSVQLRYAIDALLSHPKSGVLFAENDNGIQGFVAGIMVPFQWDHSRITCEEVAWWVSPDAPSTTALRLFKAHIKAGKDAGAVMFTHHFLTKSPPGVEKLYRKLGAKPIQSTFVQVL